MFPVVLGIDTSGSWCSAAIVRGTEVFAQRAEVGNAHSAYLLSMIDAVLSAADVALADCDAIAFGAGPGSFTGLRIACAAAQGLAFGAALPVAAIGTLDAIAYAAGRVDPSARTVLAAQDARMGEVYWALFEAADDGLVARDGPALDAPHAMRESLRSSCGAEPVDVGCGNAWDAFGAPLDGLARRVVRIAAADAVDIAALGVDAVRRGRLIAADQASPIYVRNDVALTTAQREARRAARESIAVAG